MLIKNMKMYGVVLLAAGSSIRLGWPKQLLQYKGISLVSRAIETAVRSDADMVAVVIGGYATSLFPELEKFPVRMVYNQHFGEGIASSITSGLSAFNVYDLDGVVFMVCDQPYVTTNVVDDLIKRGAESEGGIVASSYGDTLGIPAFFSKKYFPELLQLKGHEGAKKLLRQYSDRVMPLSFPRGVIDIDTVGDYQQLLAV